MMFSLPPSQAPRGQRVTPVVGAAGFTRATWAGREGKNKNPVLIGVSAGLSDKCRMPSGPIYERL